MTITLNTTPELNILINQGEHFAATFQYENNDGTPVVLTGYTATLKVRSALESDTALLVLTTANNGIVITGATGTIQIIVSVADSLTLPLGKLVYDLLLIDASSRPDRLFKGEMIVQKMVSR